MKRGELKEDASKKSGFLGLLSSIIVLAILPLISAYNYGSPAELFTWEWAKFGIVLGLLFIAIFSFFNRRMQNPPVSAIAALGLSALISVPIMRRGLIDPFFNPEIIDWIAVIAIGIALIFLFYKFGMRIDDYGRKRFSLGRFFIFLVVVLVLVYFIADYLPENIMYGPIGDWIDIIRGLGTTTIVIIGLILIGLWLWGRHRERRSYKWEGYYKAQGADRAKRGWFGFGRGKKQSTPYYQNQEANVP